MAYLGEMIEELEQELLVCERHCRFLPGYDVRRLHTSGPQPSMLQEQVNKIELLMEHFLLKSSRNVSLDSPKVDFRGNKMIITSVM